MMTFLVLIFCSCYILSTNSLIVRHNFESGVKEYSYQTFSGVAMYDVDDAPSKTAPGNGNSYVEFDLELERSLSEQQASLELILIPDIHIRDIGIEKDSQLHLCCTQELIDDGQCTQIGKLIVAKDIEGIHRAEIDFEDSQAHTHFKQQFPVEVTSIHVFAMASCDENLGEVTFSGTSTWMNPYGHLPGDVYGYLPFYGWMCLIYLLIGLIWFAINAFYWSELLHVQNCITGVLAMLLIEMSTWYFHYLHLNQKGYIHHGPFLLGLITTVTRRMVSRMLVVAVSLGYGVVKTTLGPVRNKIIVLGIFYWIFAFMFEALIHFNQTEKVETWMRSLLIPPVAIINGIFWWWTFVALNRTIEQLKVRQQTAKLQLYKSFTCVLVVALIAAIGFAIYEMYYVLKELYFAEWERLWFMEVGFWQILFSAVFVTIMILWRPSENAQKRISMQQLRSGDFDDEDMDEDALSRMVPDTMADYGDASGSKNRRGGGGNSNNVEDEEYDEDGDDIRDGGASNNNGGSTTARFMITGDGDDDEQDEDESKPKTTLASALINMADEIDQDVQIAAQKMD